MLVKPRVWLVFTNLEVHHRRGEPRTFVTLHHRYCCAICSLPTTSVNPEGKTLIYRNLVTKFQIYGVDILNLLLCVRWHDTRLFCGPGIVGKKHRHISQLCLLYKEWQKVKWQNAYLDCVTLPKYQGLRTNLNRSKWSTHYSWTVNLTTLLICI